MEIDMMRKSLPLALCILLGACDGPHEDAGERIDAARGETAGESSIVAGPAEKRGEARDHVRRRAADARRAASKR